MRYKKTLKIEAPAGYEIDRKLSTVDLIVFKRLGKLTSEQLLIERKKYIKQRLQKATILKPIVDQLSRELFISTDTIYRDFREQ
jgi:hypothetical protein